MVPDLAAGDLVAFIAGAVVVLVDGPRAVPVAAAATAIGLAPVLATLLGGDAALVLLGLGAAVAPVALVARLGGRRLSPTTLGARTSVVAPPDALFGPRSIRVAAGAALVPAASWVSFNVPFGTATTVSGVLFGASLLWGCGALRVLTARTIDDLALGVAVIGLAGAAGWQLSLAGEPVRAALAAAVLAPAAGAVSGWLGGYRPATPAAT